MTSARTLRRNLLDWYESHRRDLPWRRTSDPYRIWVSEIMLQQTRVAAVIPYYARFLERFGSVEALAAAPEQDLLAAWAGLGYYSRARNLQKAAQRIVEAGEFPSTFEAIRALPGVGEYTAAAVASIAFGLPHAAVDGNVIRVLSRVAAEPGDVRSTGVRSRICELAGRLLDRKRPGAFNQALMELGATVCLPVQPHCLECPIARTCEACALGRQRDFPVKQRKASPRIVEESLLVIRRGCRILFWQRPPDSPRMAGFWDLPRAAQLPKASVRGSLGRFRHTMVDTNYRFNLVEASMRAEVDGFRWIGPDEMKIIPLSTTARKALVCLEK